MRSAVWPGDLVLKGSIAARDLRVACTEFSGVEGACGWKKRVGSTSSGWGASVSWGRGVRLILNPALRKTETLSRYTVGGASVLEVTSCDVLEQFVGPHAMGPVVDVVFRNNLRLTDAEFTGPALVNLSMVRSDALVPPPTFDDAVGFGTLEFINLDTLDTAFVRGRPVDTLRVATIWEHADLTGLAHISHLASLDLAQMPNDGLSELASLERVDELRLSECRWRT